MRKKIIFALLVLVLLVIGAIYCFPPAKPHAGPWKLSDGTELSLAGVTHGSGNKMRYGNGVADYLYPILTPALRTKFNSRVATLPGVPSNSVVLWFWNTGNPATTMATPGSTAGFARPMFRGPENYTLMVVDENGMESSQFQEVASGWWNATNLLRFSVPHEFPRRSREIRLRVYNWNNLYGIMDRVGEFTIPNPLSTNYPVWKPQAMPVRLNTNGMDITLLAFETGVSADKASRLGTLSGKTFTRAEVTISNATQPLEWEVQSAAAKSATGETHWAIIANSTAYGYWAADPDPSSLPAKNHAHTFLEFPGTCWLEEPAWKIVLELTRVTNFPPDELWAIEGIKIPEKGQANQLNLKTNLNGTEIEFVGLSTQFSGWGSTQRYLQSQSAPAHEIKVLSPFGLNDAHLKIRDIFDDQGRTVGIRLLARTPYMRGTNPSNIAMENSFYLTIPTGAKSINVTLAYPKSQFVEMLARPARARDSR